MADDRISIDDFAKVELKTAEVLEVEKVEGADKLLKLQIKVGEENRQIVEPVGKSEARPGSRPQALDLDDGPIVGFGTLVVADRQTQLRALREGS